MAKVVGEGPAPAPVWAALAASRRGGAAIWGSLAEDAVADWTEAGALLEAAGVGASEACVDRGWAPRTCARGSTGVDDTTLLEVLGFGVARLAGDELALGTAEGAGDDVAVGVAEGSGEDVAVGVAEGSGEDVAVGVPDGVGVGVGVAVGSADGDGSADEADGEALGAGEASAGRMRATVAAETTGPGCTPAYAPA
jgi:hypothetical protein